MIQFHLTDRLNIAIFNFLFRRGNFIIFVLFLCLFVVEPALFQYPVNRMALNANKLGNLLSGGLRTVLFHLADLFIPRLGPMMITHLLPLYAQLSFLLTVINSGVDLDFFY